MLKFIVTETFPEFHFLPLSMNNLIGYSDKFDQLCITIM